MCLKTAKSTEIEGNREDLRPFLAKKPKRPSRHRIIVNLTTYSVASVIFDDVDKDIEKWLPPSGSSDYAIILTSRIDWQKKGMSDMKTINLEPLSEDDAVSVLRSFTHKKQDEITTPFTYKTIAEFVGCLPLGLTLIGRYLQRYPDVNVNDLTDKLKSHVVNFIVMDGGEEGDSLQRNDTYRQAYEGITKILDYDWGNLTHSAKQLACVLGLFDVAPKVFAPENINDSEALQSLSLITGNETDNYLHPLVAEYFYKKLLQDSSFYKIENLLFENYATQQYLYDAGYLERRKSQLEEILKRSAEDSCSANLKLEILFNKLLGHVLYGDRDRALEEAVYLMETAFSKAEILSQQDKTHLIPIQWYQTFLCDHIYNLLYKTETEYSEKANFYKDKCLEILPDSLKTLEKMPSKDNYPVVLRAAHYWGHRGNQAVYFLGKNLDEKQYDFQIGKEGIQSYLLASIYRLFVFSGSFEEQEVMNTFNSVLSKVCKLKLEDAKPPVWINDLVAMEKKPFSKEIEVFKSPAQALGDIAHQYRGMASIYLKLLLIENAEQAALKEAKKAISLAEVLWDSSIELAKKKHERVIKYYIWMSNLKPMLSIAESYLNSNTLPDKNEMLKLCNDTCKKMSHDYDISDEDSTKRVLEELEKFYENARKRRSS